METGSIYYNGIQGENMIYFYANEVYICKSTLSSYEAQEVVKEMNIISEKQWSYKRGKK